MKKQRLSSKYAMRRLASFIKAGGPEESEYAELTGIWDILNEEEKEAASKASSGEKLYNLFGPDFLNQTMQGFAFRKPHGYAGDFEIIDNIYMQKINKDIKFQKWDKYLQAQQATQAVRNRKNYFIELVKARSSELNRPLRILNLASGPCRDVLELFERVPEHKLQIQCVEMDPKAIEYARNLLRDSSNSVKFIQANIFKFMTSEKFDLIWSAGLFDYLDDDTFIRLLSRISSWCAPSGEMVIGNFSVANPSRSYMEKAGGWYLFHRTRKELIEFALKAGLKPGNIEVRNEELGVNLFLHIREKS